MATTHISKEKDRLTIIIPKELKEILTIMAADNYVSCSTYIVQILAKHINSTARPR